MDKLFSEVVKISKIETIHEKDLLESHINQVVELVTMSHEKIIRSYASKHCDNAILLIINSNYLYKKIINIKKLLEPDSHLIKKHEEYNIKSLDKRLAEYFYPFVVKVIKGNSVIKLIENNIKHKLNINNIDTNIICISISWNG